MNEREIGGIGNYYGGLSVLMAEGKYYWGIENHDGIYWEEIPRYLFDALNKYEEERKK